MADSHVRMRTWTNNTAVYGDAYAALAQVADETSDMTDTVVIAGDWFDTNRPSSSDLDATFGFLSRYRNVYFIRGNHDSVFPSFLMAAKQVLSDSISIEPLDGRCVQLPCGTCLYGVSWASSRTSVLDSLSEISSKIGQSPEGSRHVVVMHAGLKEMIGLSGAYDFTAAEIAGRLAASPGRDVRVVIGHVHTPRVFTESGVEFTSPGALYPNSSAESGKRHFVCVWDDDLHRIQYDCDVREYHNLTASAGIHAALLDVLESNELPLDPYVRISVPAGFTGDIDVPDGLVAQLDVAANDETAAQMMGAGTELSLADAVAQECGDDERLRELCLDIMAADDPLALVSKWLDDWRVERLCTD